MPTVAVRATSNTDALKALGAKTVVADALDAATVQAAFASGSYKVVAFEPLTVPAGTFDCFKVEGKAEAAYKASYQQQVRETYWYCPKVNGVAKLSRETATTSRDSPSSREKTE